MARTTICNSTSHRLKSQYYIYWWVIELAETKEYDTNDVLNIKSWPIFGILQLITYKCRRLYRFHALSFNGALFFFTFNYRIIFLFCFHSIGPLSYCTVNSINFSSLTHPINCIRFVYRAAEERDARILCTKRKKQKSIFWLLFRLRYFTCDFTLHSPGH